MCSIFSEKSACELAFKTTMEDCPSIARLDTKSVMSEVKWRQKLFSSPEEGVVAFISMSM